MSITTPSGCRLEALRLIDASNEAASLGLRVAARNHYERARELLLLAKKLEADEMQTIKAFQ